MFLLTEMSPPLQRSDCPPDFLHLLTPILEKAVNQTPAVVVDALVSGRLIQFYLSIGGKVVCPLLNFSKA